MEINESNNQNNGGILPQPSAPKSKKLPDADLNIETLKEFYALTGGSLFYCLSAVFTAYGIVKIMGPILAEGKTLLDVMPCILTLHIYELALLAVLVLIVFKKVVDDAISIMFLIALFLVGTSVAVGTSIGNDVSTALVVALAGILIALAKFGVMRRFCRIRFGALSFLALIGLMAFNYLGPVVLSQSISLDATQELVRRELWIILWLVVLTSAVLVFIEALKANKNTVVQQNSHLPFLQRPIMAHIFALILFIASCAHQYSLSFTFALERVGADYVLAVTVAVIILIEILRQTGKHSTFAEVVMSCIPLATMLLAIKYRSVLASGELNLDLLSYPPVTLLISGIVISVLAVCHRQRALWAVVFVYALGVILTFGFSPESPHDLNIRACAAVLMVVLLVYGIIRRNQYMCVAAIAILCAGLALWDGYSDLAKGIDLTEAGGLAGVFGICLVALYLVFGRLHKAVRAVIVLCLGGFLLDFLPQHANWEYLVTLFCIVILMLVLWRRAKDLLLPSFLFVPYAIKLYIIAKHFAYWRLVIVGFLLLAAGTVASLLKRRRPKSNNLDNSA